MLPMFRVRSPHSFWTYQHIELDTVVVPNMRPPDFPARSLNALNLSLMCAGFGAFSSMVAGHLRAR